MATDVINGTEDYPQQKCQIHNYQNKDRLRQYVGYFCSSENQNWAAQNPPLGRGLDMADLDSRAEVPNLGYMYICLSEGVHLMSATEDKFIFTYLLFPNIYTNISEYYFQKPLYTNI